MMEGNSVQVSTECQTRYSFSINLGKCRPKNQSLHQFNNCNNIEKKTKFHFSITIVGFEGIGHYQASEQRCYFEEMINFIH